VVKSAYDVGHMPNDVASMDVHNVKKGLCKSKRSTEKEERDV
jgi:hypothetical protein